jgi:colanic acid biosynthesis protein WcaM
VDIRRYQTTDWPAALKQAFSEAQTVEIRKAWCVKTQYRGLYSAGENAVGAGEY